MGDLAVFKGGSAFPQNEQGASSGFIPFMKVSDLSRGTGAWQSDDAANWLSEEQLHSLRPTVAPPGSTVFAKIGEGLRSERCRLLVGPSAVDNNMMAAIPTPLADPSFLYYLLKTVGLSTYAVGSALPYLRQSTLNEIPVDVPVKAEQQVIGEALGSLDHKIAANTKLSETAISLLEAHFDALGLNRDPAEDETVVGLDELVFLNPKLPAPAEAEPVYVDMQKLPVSNMSISDWDHRPAKGGARFMNEDTLMARITPCLENRKTGFVDFLEEGQIAIGSTEFIVLRARPGVPAALSYFLATSERFRTFAIRHMVGTSGRQRVSALDLSGYTVRKPAESALTKFGDAAKSTFPLVKSLTDENRTLAATRDALLPQLISGNLRVRDAEKVLENAGV
ncbi:restriction endonuclease subunit S [Pseudarthrobacter oxydans]|uniref:restriction endonuclease subunit S n=1 Tax=Pseudarthrobacter oxydans TaxID=1671 RepID=UPI0038031EE7